MSKPNDYKREIKLTRTPVGEERRQSYLDNIDLNNGYLPKGVDYIDMDKSFSKFVEDDVNLVIDGEKVKSQLLTLQRWNEFRNSWDKKDSEFGTLKLPLLTIVRDPNVEEGEMVESWNIPNNRLYSYIKIPTFENGNKGVDIYKIPQPTKTNINYSLRFFSNRLAELNVIQKKIQKLFNSRQFYVDVNGHFMPLLLEGIEDESKIDDIDKRKYYSLNFTFKLMGYILDENDFIRTSMLDKLTIKIDQDLNSTKRPNIRLKGDNRILINVGETYSELGYVAIDRNEGDISNDVIVDTNLDITKVGTYTITYNVKNSKGKKSKQVVRIIKVV